MLIFRKIVFWLLIIWALIGSAAAYYFYNKCPEEISAPIETVTEIKEPTPVTATPISVDTTKDKPKTQGLIKKTLNKLKRPFSSPNIHVVRGKKEDRNLYRIGLLYEVHHDTLAKWNNLQSADHIEKGQRIFIGTPEQRAKVLKEELERVKADTTACDTIRNYEIPFAQKGVEGVMLARVHGKLLYGHVELKSKPLLSAKPKNHLWLQGGVGLDVPNLSIGGMYTVQDKWGIGYEWSPSQQSHTHEIKGAYNIF